MKHELDGYSERVAEALAAAKRIDQAIELIAREFQTVVRGISPDGVISQLSKTAELRAALRDAPLLESTKSRLKPGTLRDGVMERVNTALSKPASKSTLAADLRKGSEKFIAAVRGVRVRPKRQTSEPEGFFPEPVQRRMTRQTGVRQLHPALPQFDSENSVEDRRVRGRHDSRNVYPDAVQRKLTPGVIQAEE